jgi:pimeloyl-ACP methyl ester carboxylesterase
MGKTRRFAEISGSKIFQETRGEGSPLVFIHGGLSDHRFWDDQFDFFAEHFKVFRYDVRGFGQSETPKEPFFAHQDLDDLLDFWRVEKAHLLGISMGGGIAIDYGLEYPHRVRSLILAAPSLGGFLYSEGLMQKGLELITLSLEGGEKEALQVLFEDPYWEYTVPPRNRKAAREKMWKLARAFFEVLRWDMNLMQSVSPPAIDRLSEIEIPTLVIAAGLDHPDNLRVVDRLASDIKGAEKVEIPDVGHMMNLEAPQKFNKIVLDFLITLGDQ